MWDKPLWGHFQSPGLYRILEMIYPRIEPLAVFEAGTKFNSNVIAIVTLWYFNSLLLNMAI
jgi:hypothetical protein